MDFWKFALVVCLAGLLRVAARTDSDLKEGQVEFVPGNSVSRDLKSFGGFHDRYEWGKEYQVPLDEGYQKGICFERGSTSCVEYSFMSSAPLLAFVANRQFTALALKGIQKVGYIAESDCRGTNCTDIKVSVSDKHSYCLVILNRENKIPEFSQPANTVVSLSFKVNGCPSTFWTIVSIVIVIVITISIVACCVGVCVHIKKTKTTRRPPNQHPQVQHIAHVQMGRTEAAGQAAPPQHHIHFMEAKI